MKEKPENLTLVILGASGDLTAKKLMPALFDLFTEKLLPTNFAILGVGRTSLNDDAFREKISRAVSDSREEKNGQQDQQVLEFAKSLHYLALNTDMKEDYVLLRERLANIETERSVPGNHIFYLAVPPQMYLPVTESLASQGLNVGKSANNFVRIIVEKPFGTDLQSAKILNRELHKFFKEEQIYRIDHYLGKETVQNILVTRFANGIFEPLWNRNYIHHIEITSAENSGIGSRGGYYEGAGALRDMVQNHLLQLVAMIAMEPPVLSDSVSVRNETLKVFQALRPLTQEDIGHSVIRGQYTASHIKGELVPGYREELNVSPESRTETYIGMKFFLDNWRWAGVPFYIRTGKRLPTRVTEAVIHFHTSPHRIFEMENDSDGDNQLIIRIQPDEGILLKFGMKVPGEGFKVKRVDMDFRYSDISDIRLPSAYERLLLNCMQGDSTLYLRSDASEATWSFITPILQTWENNPALKVYGYPAGTWGPDAADALIEPRGTGWRYPCKNLTNDGIICEL
ncbi:MAG: glucose-6-phosphate dehydrogenase [SAR324 cluster bacterium]|uniref:Glucose-6-phosphate 1-dehydrogenase n=1 Tax=SAR324 cluster bacterium TaxID=2024889 RepID=A0A7X9FT23_9DELT|nr:glucose-6-phosphate dehydrogenase [SAR324 cluster bacterium]